MRKVRKPDRQASVSSETSEEPTQPLPNVAPLAFEEFLARHRLSMLDVARAASVRLLTIWRVMRDLPVSEQQAAQVRVGLYRLTGVQYRRRIRLYTVGEKSQAARPARGSRKARGVR